MCVNHVKRRNITPRAWSRDLDSKYGKLANQQAGPNLFINRISQLQL